MIFPDQADEAAFDIAVRQALQHVATHIICPYFGQLSDDMVRTKSSPDDFVTQADIEAEAYLTQKLAPLLPGGEIIGEEASSAQNKASTPSTAKTILTIDPLDGTRNFVRKNTSFCSMVSLIDEGGVHSAWIYRPLEGDCFYARAGAGVSHIGADGTKTLLTRPVFASDFYDVPGTANAMGLSEPQRQLARDRLKTHNGRYHIGSAGLDAVALAQGNSAFVMHSKLTPWDSCPAALFAQEAGYIVKMAPDGSAFSPFKKGVLLMAQNERIWSECCDFVFRGAD